MSELYWLTEAQVDRLKPYFPKSRGKPRVDDRRVLSGIIFIQRNGLMWNHAPAAYGVCQRSCPPILRGVSDFGDAGFVFGIEPDWSGGLPVAGFA